MKMMNAVDSQLYHVVHYAGNGDTRRIEFTLECYRRAALVAFNGQFKPLSGEAVKMLIESADLGRFDTATKPYISSVVNELVDPWEYSKDGAELFPEEFQPWESDNSSFFIIDNPKRLGGNWVASTHHAEVAVSLINIQLNDLKERIRSMERLSMAA
jgi:hypothetical protein